jgi:hypothetical protein
MQRGDLREPARLAPLEREHACSGRAAFVLCNALTMMSFVLGETKNGKALSADGGQFYGRIANTVDTARLQQNREHGLERFASVYSRTANSKGL